DQGRREMFKDRFKAAQAVAGDTTRLAETRKIDPNRPAYGLTRQILYEYANDPANGPDLPPGVWVEAMTAYPSYHSFVQEVKIDYRHPPEAKDKTLAGVFGWEFFAPDEPGMESMELLESLAQFVKEGDFAKKRRDFHDLRRSLIQRGAPDKAAVE